MTALYNCRHSGDQYRISKFDGDTMNVESSYLTTLSECDCPAGVRDTCRHRTMLHKFLARNAVNTHWMYDHDRDGWVQTDLGEEPAALDLSHPVNDTTPGAVPGTGGVAGDMTPPLPEGVTFIDLSQSNGVVDLHNAIADGVGEPEAKLRSFRRGL